MSSAKTKATKDHKICSIDEMRKGTGEDREVPSILPEKVEMCCHGNFVPLKILVRDQFFQEKSFHPDRFFLKKMDRS